MSTKHYAVIGHPIGHTMSPFIHKRLFELAGADADYTHLDIAPETLAEEYQNRLRHLDGFNITIPHKETIIPLLDALDDKAKMYGSVNRRQSDRLHHRPRRLYQGAGSSRHRP